MFINRFHPGVYLQEFLNDYNITAYKLAKDIKIPQTRISQILKGNRSITIDTASRFSVYFGNSVEQWLNMQRSYDLFKYDKESIENITPLANVG